MGVSWITRPDRHRAEGVAGYFLRLNKGCLSELVHVHLDKFGSCLPLICVIEWWIACRFNLDIFKCFRCCLLKLNNQSEKLTNWVDGLSDGLRTSCYWPWPVRLLKISWALRTEHFQSSERTASDATRRCFPDYSGTFLGIFSWPWWRDWYQKHETNKYIGKWNAQDQSNNWKLWRPRRRLLRDQCQTLGLDAISRSISFPSKVLQ